VLYTGKYAGHQYGQGHGNQLYDPFENKQCSDPAITPRCRPLGGSGEAAVVDTADTSYLGFGLEGITGADTRNTILGRPMSYLLR
jgi:hypothetical protein